MLRTGREVMHYTRQHSTLRAIIVALFSTLKIQDSLVYILLENTRIRVLIVVAIDGCLCRVR